VAEAREQPPAAATHLGQRRRAAKQHMAEQQRKNGAEQARDLIG